MDQPPPTLMTITPGPGFTRYATDVIVQTTDYEYILSFYEVRPPIQLEPPTPDAQRSVSTPVEAELVARLVVAHNKLPLLIEALASAEHRRSSLGDQG